MSTTTRAYRRIAGRILVIALCACFSTAVQASGPAESHYSAPELRALKIRSKALNCLYVRADACLTDAELHALTIRSEALTRPYGGG